MLLWLFAVGGQSLAELLVSQGLARTKGVRATGPTGEPAHAVEQKLFTLEQDAKQHQNGVWAISTLTYTAPAPPAR
jgi:endonuclease YncB( thermonuclease family)